MNDGKKSLVISWLKLNKLLILFFYFLMKLLVFKKEGGFTADIINLFDEQGYGYFVDAIHLDDYDYLKKNFYDIPHLLCYITMTNMIMWVNYKRLPGYSRVNTPDFIVYFDGGEVLDWADWTFLEKYVKDLFSFSELPLLTKRQDYLLFTGLRPEQIAPVSENGDVKMIDDDDDTSIDEDFYDFREYVVKERDVGFFEIRKPFTDLPYTIVIRNFSKVGYLPLFSGFYIEMSWGVSPKDDAYLRYLWKKLKMEGDCDLEKLQRERAMSCYPGKGSVPEPQPEVYRKSIEDVRTEFEMKETGLGLGFY